MKIQYKCRLLSTSIRNISDFRSDQFRQMTDKSAQK